MVTFEQLQKGEVALAVVGLGYVGLPLAITLSRHFRVVGFDISTRRVAELRSGRDRTGEAVAEDLEAAKIIYTSDPGELARTAFIIIAVPTPIDEHRRPDLRPIRDASIIVGKHLRTGSVVVYESTVYPGLTEEICVPLLEENSGLICGRDFWVGYSPERINPGDRVHTLETIVKVVAGQDRKTTELLAAVYGTVVKAGIHKASSIKVAEAAKVIENTQRDLNIALTNELSLIFARMGIDTLEVLKAASTKWNFLSFRPGLVGGHCIGVDPYYLTFKAEALGLHPQVILAGRRINDSMGKYVAEMTIKGMIQKNCRVNGARVGVLGLTFKENVNDLRNTKVVNIIRELEEFCIEVLVHDPLADSEEAKAIYDLNLLSLEEMRELDALILAVPHNAYSSLSLEAMRSWFRDPRNGLLLDIKGFFEPDQIKAAGLNYWRL